MPGLRARLSLSCPTENTLTEFVAGRLSTEAIEGVTCHLDACEACAHLWQVLVTSGGGGATRGGEAEARLASLSERVEEFRLLELLGQGSMGQVYRAHDGLLDRTVAIKFVLSNDTATRERFVNEARAIARLSHPNVVAIYRVGEHEGRPYLVSEFVRGTSLDRLPRPQPWQQALQIGTDLARGLAAAHRRGVLHRDIKPANAVLADDGAAKLLDFGLAKLDTPPVAVGHSPEAPAGTATSMPQTQTGAATTAVAQAGAATAVTQAGALLGTPLYLAPEL